MKNRPKQFLVVSFAIIIVLCIGIFFFQIFYMEQKSSQTINDVGTIYMGGMNDQISKHFKTNMELYWTKVNGVLQTVPPEECEYGSGMLAALTDAGKKREFECLFLITRAGEIEMIYGEAVTLATPEAFLEALNADERKIALAETGSGKKIALMGISTIYPMGEGRICTGIVAGVPVEYLEEKLALDYDTSFVHSSIIRQEGEFVIQGEGNYANYFDRLRDIIPNEDKEHAEKYIAELKNAMETKEDYSMVISVGEERKQLYCTALPDSEWYLLTVMPYGTLDKAVSNLDEGRLFSVFLCCGIIVLVFLVLFIIYYNLIHQQMVQLEEARAQADHANRAKSEFLSNMSHDIRTPMNAIVGMTSIAMSNMDNQSQVENCLKKIVLASKHLLGLINNILDMSKIESGKLTLNLDVLSLREMTENLVNTIQPQIKSKKQKFDVIVKNVETEKIYCDGVRLNQILLNLLSNAMKFTPEKGSICFEMEEEASPKGERHVRVHLKVRDNGIGMSEEFQKRVYESFLREDSLRVHKTEGAGLGMAITKYIVDAMEGTIEVQSRINEGTEFHVILDVERVVEREEEMQLPDWNILVVDDNEELCKSAVSSLEDIGLKAEWTLDGASAVRMVNEHHKNKDDYHIVLLDWKMPGMNGIETARVIRKQVGENVPILVISAYDWSEIEVEARAAGINGFISKPLFKSTLYLGLKPYAGIEVDEEVRQEEKGFKFEGSKILVAEDNDVNWEIVDVLLQELGLNLERAENGQVCIDKFSQSEEGYYDLILMDIRMPEVTGYEATETIRSMNRSDANIPIIAMTADAFAEDIEKCRECGMDGHVAKPIDMKKMLDLMEKHIKKS